MAIQVVWHKRDLRVTDHFPLFHAVKESKSLGLVLPLYIHEPLIINAPTTAFQHQAFVWECLDSLHADYQGMGGGLAEMYGNAVQVFKELHSKHGISRIICHRETTGKAEFARDLAVAAWAKANGVQFSELRQDNVIRGSEPESMKLPFQAYMDAAVQIPLKNPLGKELSERFCKFFPRINRAELARAAGKDKPLRMKGGRIEAVAKANRFFTINNILKYPYSISSPLKAENVCSHLSPYLAHGVISDRHVLFKINELVSEAAGMNQQIYEKVRSAAVFFVDRLVWRQGYIQQLEHQIDLEDTEFFESMVGMREAEHNPEHFDAWKAGLTGVPYVDAIQRCLTETGWINMRSRALLCSFACNTLWLPWRPVAEFLALQFTDFFPAIHFGQVRISSGTSHFGQLMIYDPIKNALEHDPTGYFVRKWVPELSHIKGGAVHTPWINAQDVMGSYPQPLVNVDQANKTAKIRLSKLKLGRAQAKPENMTLF